MTKETHSPGEWTPRIWQGCNFPSFMRLLCRNGFAVHPRFFYMPLVMTTVSILNSTLQMIEQAWFGSRVERTTLHASPLFILGHWRTGTTLLHELVTLDTRFSCPNTYQCLVPSHFLLTEPFADHLFWWMLPRRRPMDNMAVGWERPQEDEFALCMLGQPSPYTTIAFPNHGPQDLEALDIDGMSPRRLEAWKATLLGFLKRLTLRDPRRLVLKSPTHSFRIPVLHDMFPRAPFLHIVRNPYIVYASTVKLWRALYLTHGMQVPHFRGLEEFVFSTFSHLYDRIEIGRRLLPASQFHEIRYEDLVADPVSEIGRAYDQLGLGGFDEMRPRLEEYWVGQRGYQTNRYSALDPDVEARITERWKPVIDRYDYQPPGREQKGR